MLAHPLALTKTPAGFVVPAEHPLGRDTIVPINEPYLPVHLTPLQNGPYPAGVRPEPAEFLQNTSREADPNYFFSDEYADCWRPEVRRLALMRFRAQIERGVGRTAADEVLVAIKEPNGSHGAQPLMSLLPRSRFISRSGG